MILLKQTSYDSSELCTGENYLLFQDTDFDKAVAFAKKVAIAYFLKKGKVLLVPEKDEFVISVENDFFVEASFFQINADAPKTYLIEASIWVDNALNHYTFEVEHIQQYQDTMRLDFWNK